MRRITIYKPKQVKGRQSSFSLALSPGSTAALNSHFQVPPLFPRAVLDIICRAVIQQDEISPDHGRPDICLYIFHSLSCGRINGNFCYMGRYTYSAAFLCQARPAAAAEE